MTTISPSFEKLKSSLEGEFVFPKSDVVVKIVKNEQKTESKFLAGALSPRTPKKLNLTSSDHKASDSAPISARALPMISENYIKFGTRFYVKDWLSVDYYSKSAIPDSPLLKVTPKFVDEEFSCDLEKADDRASEFIEYSKIIARGGDKNVLHVVPTTRNNLYQMLFCPTPAIVPDFSKIFSQIDGQETRNDELYVNCGPININVNEFTQPFFCSIALYDLASKKRMTEDFLFNNLAEAGSTISSTKATPSPIIDGVNIPKINLEEKAPTAVFQLPMNVKRENLYFVVTLYKILYKGDADDFFDFITKDKKEKERKKYLEEIREALPRLSEFRQNVAWAAVSLNTKFKATKVPVRFTRMNKNLDIYSYLEEVKQKTDKKEKLKFDFGGCDFELTIVPFEEKLPSKVPRIDTNYCRFLNKGNEEMPSALELELLTFERSQKILTEYFSNLHIYPNLGSFSRTRFKNIAVSVKILSSDTSVDTPGIEVIYDDHPSKPFLKERTFAVFYDEKKPKFLDGAKLKLPMEINKKTHLLFTFSSVECKEPKKGELSKTVFGYAFLPLMDKQNNLIDTSLTFDIPVAKELLAGYLSMESEDISWLEGKKVSLSLDLYLHSSIYPNDVTLYSFLSSGNVADLMKVADPSEVVRFLPHILYVLCKNCCSPNDETLSASNFYGILWTIHTVEKNTKRKLLDEFIHNKFDIEELPDLWFFLSKNWTKMLLNSEQQNEEMASINSLHYSRFLMAMILKSMTLSLYSRGVLDQDLNRKDRLKSYMANDLNNLILSIARAVVNATDFQSALITNANLAHFINDLASLLDCDLIFEFIRKIFHLYKASLITNQSLQVSLSLKLPFCRILAQSPLYNSLNFPGQAPDIGNTNAELLEVWKKTYFLASILCECASQAFRSKEKHLIMMVVNTISSLFYWNDHDPRFQSQHSRIHLASLYFPIIIEAVDCYVEIIRKIKFDNNEAKALYSMILYILKDTSGKLYEKWWQRERELKIFTFFALLKQCISVFKYNGESKARTMRTENFHEILKEMQQIPVLYPDGLTSLNILRRNRENPEELGTTAGGGMKESESSHALINNEEEKKAKDGKKDKKTKEKKGTGVLAGEVQYNAPFEIKRHMDDYATFLAQKKTKLILDSDHELLKEKNLVSEVSHIILDVTVAFILKFKSLLKLETRIQLFEEAFSIFPALLKEKQSNSVITRIFATLYLLLPQFEETLFVFKNSIFGDIIYAILSQCNSKSKVTRDQAISLYIFLLEKNSEVVQNIARIKLQTTIAITKIVGDENSDISSEWAIKTQSHELLVKTFGAVLKKFLATPLKKQIIDLDKKINNVIEGDRKMKQYSHDIEMMAQLQYTISCQLQESPDERITWLQNLALFHAQHKNLEEVAIVKVLTAALIQEYLTLISRWSTKLPAAFQLVSPNIQKMLGIPSKESLRALEDEICQSKLFNHEGFIQLLKEAIGVLREGGFYESALTAYQMVLPVFQESRDYAKQKICHQELVQLTDTLMDESQMKQRIFSNYYRVAFYGKKFEEMDKKAYVYKEHVTTMLAEFTSKILEQFKKKFGADNVLLMKNVVAKDFVFDPEKCYLQIGSVFPHFSEKELQTRTSEWSKVFDVDSFYMDQPFTKNGQAQHATSHEDQWIRRQIYKTEYAFPFLLKRILITRTSEQELSPIENAIIAITDKLNTFNSELNSSNPRIKILQMDLQGTLLLQVNAGPMALVITFLSEENKDKYKEEYRNLLADRFHQFVRTLHHSVVLNGTLKSSLKADEGQQQLLQDTLEEQLKLMTEKMKEFPIFSQRIAALANERVKQDNLISQQVSRTLTFDVSEIGVENIRARRDSMKNTAASYNTLSKDKDTSDSISGTPQKSPTPKTKTGSTDDLGIKGRGLPSQRKSRENRRSLMSPKTSTDSPITTPSKGFRTDFTEKLPNSRPSTPKKEEPIEEPISLKSKPSPSSAGNKRIKEKHLSSKDEVALSASQPVLSSPTSVTTPTKAKTVMAIPSSKDSTSKETSKTKSSKSQDTASASTTSTPSKSDKGTTTPTTTSEKESPAQDERLVTIRLAVKKMCEELKLQVQGLLTPDENDVNKLFPLLKLYKSITSEIKRVNDVLPVKDYSSQPPSTLSQNRVLLVKYLIDKENEQIQLMLGEVESGILNISDPNVFKTVIQILRDVIAIIKDK